MAILRKFMRQTVFQTAKTRLKTIFKVEKRGLVLVDTVDFIFQSTRYMLFSTMMNIIRTNQIHVEFKCNPINEKNVLKGKHMEDNEFCTKFCPKRKNSFLKTFETLL